MNLLPKHSAFQGHSYPKGTFLLFCLSDGIDLCQVQLITSCTSGSGGCCNLTSCTISSIQFIKLRQACDTPFCYAAWSSKALTGSYLLWSPVVPEDKTTQFLDEVQMKMKYRCMMWAGAAFGFLMTLGKCCPAVSFTSSCKLMIMKFFIFRSVYNFWHVFLHFSCKKCSIFNFYDLILGKFKSL